MGFFSGNYLPVKENSAACRFVKPGEAVKDRGFTGSVGPDKAGNGALFNREGEITDNLETGKAQDKIFNFK